MATYAQLKKAARVIIGITTGYTQDYGYVIHR